MSRAVPECPEMAACLTVASTNQSELECSVMAVCSTTASITGSVSEYSDVGTCSTVASITEALSDNSNGSASKDQSRSDAIVTAYLSDVKLNTLETFSDLSARQNQANSNSLAKKAKVSGASEQPIGDGRELSSGGLGKIWELPYRFTKRQQLNIASRQLTREADEALVKSKNRITANNPDGTDIFRYHVGLDENLPPLSKIEDIFADMVDKSLLLGLEGVINQLNGRRLVVATMCSGTESPVLALKLVCDILQSRGFNFDFYHSFSAEIVPYKQAYIERNFAPPILFRDIKEFISPQVTVGTTAYGGEAKIPENVDILVAGFACVDFSSLNARKQALDGGGESADTLEGVYRYAEKFRPTMVILENVSGAPWKTIKDMWPKIGYTATFLRVDTKDYYIPHTRTRGYMLCIDDGAYPGSVEETHCAQSVALKWETLMKTFKRKASCSVEEFLLDESDPRVIRAMEELSARSTRVRNIGWSSSKGRHHDYREVLELGQKRPITNWQDGGSCKATDQMWRGWIVRQVERVWDAVEISYLRCLRRGFDFQHKFRFLDLSQNIDRNMDSMPAGIANCVTPSGIPYNTIRGGPIIGLEALALQGIPIDQLQLTRERQSQLQDLAGNAMSSTVVGSAILSALIAGFFGLRPGGQDSMKTIPAVTLSNVVGESYLNSFYLDLDRYEPLSVRETLDKAANSVRLCLCEGRMTITEALLQKCVLCKHTACINCSGNPEHAYAPLPKDISLKRILPDDFISFLKKGIPMRLQMTGIAEDEVYEIRNQNMERIDYNSWEILINYVQKAIKSELRFYSMKRSDSWTIFYKSEYAQMELVVKSDYIEWRLYAKPPPTSAVNSPLRRLLVQPIARMRPIGDDLTQGLWQLWLPKQEVFNVNITGQGDLSPSFESSQEIGKFKNELVWTEYKVSISEPVSETIPASIAGTYRLLRGCGMASGSLHVQTETAHSENRMFFFLDPHRLHEPSKDSYVFSVENRRLDFGERRQVFAALDSSWRPPVFYRLSQGKSHSYRLRGTEQLLSELEIQAPIKAKCYVDGGWADLPNAKFRDSGHLMESFRCIPPGFDVSSDLISCRNAHAIFSCETFIPRDEHSDWKRGRWIEISRSEQKDFFTSFAWITDRACLLHGLDEWRPIPSVSGICPTCAPVPPRIKWRIKPPKIPKMKIATSCGVASTGEDALKNDSASAINFESLVQMENPEDISSEEYHSDHIENLYQFNPEELVDQMMDVERPPQEELYNSGEMEPVDATGSSEEAKNQQQVDSPDRIGRKEPARRLIPFEEPGDAAHFELQLKCRPHPLVTQVHIDDTGLIKLKIAFNPMTLIHRATAKLPPSENTTEISWRLITDYSPAVKLSLPRFKIPDNNKDLSAINPTDFTIKLRPEQLRSLWWMLYQESDRCEPFIEEEIEEVVIPELRWRGEGRVTKSVTVKGGVLADEVGYGKTAVTLALIESQRERDALLANDSITEGRISLKATLILVPQQLSNQWLDEIKKFLGKKRSHNVMVLKSAVSLNKKTIADFQKADIIIVNWKFLEGQAYLFKIADLSGMVELPKLTSTRAAAAWYSQALKEISGHVEILKGGGRTLNDLIKAKFKDNEEEAANAETFIPSRRFRGQAYKDQKEKVTNGSKRKYDLISPDINIEDNTRVKNSFGLGDIASGKTWTSLKSPPFEIFEFARVVIDEYTYVNGKENLTLLGLKAHYRWILSATPPLQDFADVKCIAHYLGINLGVDDVTPGVIRASNITALEQDATFSEQFQSYQVNPSMAWHENRARVAQRFLDQFVRRNTPDIKAISTSSHVMPVSLPPPERALYIELNQLLVLNDFNTSRLVGDASNDRTRRVRELFRQSSNAGEALIKSASQFTLEFLRKRKMGSSAVCETMYKVRAVQLHHTKKELASALKHSQWLESACTKPPPSYLLWKSQVCDNYFGDLGAMHQMKAIIAVAEDSSKDDDWKEFYLTPEEMDAKQNRDTLDKDKPKAKRTRKADPGFASKEDQDSMPDFRPLKPEGAEKENGVERAALALRRVVNRLHQLSTELVCRTRCMRFLKCVCDIQDLVANLGTHRGLQREAYACSTCKNTKLSAEIIWILTQCGHRICSDCRKCTGDIRDECHFPGCKAVNRAHQMIKVEEFAVRDEEPRTSFNHGKKIEDIVDLIHNIPEKDQIIVFIQFPELAEKVKDAFDEGEITYIHLAGPGDAAKRLTAFQTINAKETRKQVLILNIGDESAAGSNLTNANHVILLSPYLTDSQQRYNHAMTQAIGRARRYGQMKHVHVYHFVSLKTIDVDVLQMRTNKVLTKSSDKNPHDLAQKLTCLPFEEFVPSAFELEEAEEGREDVWGEFGAIETYNFLKNTEDF